MTPTYDEQAQERAGRDLWPIDLDVCRLAWLLDQPVMKGADETAEQIRDLINEDWHPLVVRYALNLVVVDRARFDDAMDAEAFMAAVNERLVDERVATA
jgi:hypothetical protein